MIAGAVTRRHEHAVLLAWQTANLMNAVARFNPPVTVERLAKQLEPFTADPRVLAERAANEEAVAAHAHMQMAAAAAAGFGVVGQLTPEELALAYEQATVR